MMISKLFLYFELISSIHHGVCGSILLQVGLSVTVNSEVGEKGLITSCLSFSDVCHLYCLFPELPLVPTVIWIDILLNEMCWCVYTLI